MSRTYQFLFKNSQKLNGLIVSLLFIIFFLYNNSISINLIIMNKFFKANWAIIRANWLLVVVIVLLIIILQRLNTLVDLSDKTSNTPRTTGSCIECV